MKKFIIALCIIAAVFTLTACSDNDFTAEPKHEKLQERVVSQGDFFTVTEITDDEAVVKYQYEVTGKDGKLLESALCAQQPVVARISDSLIGVRFSADKHIFVRYYDIDKNVVSRSFRDSFWDNGNLVATRAYDNGHYFTVQDIFDENGYKSVTGIECDSWQITVIAAKVSDDGKQLFVEYIPGDGSDLSFARSTVTLPLVEAAAKP